MIYTAFLPACTWHWLPMAHFNLLSYAGLIIADSGNMVLRILYSAWFIQTRAARQQLLDWAPHRTTLGLLAAAAFVAGWSQQTLLHNGCCSRESAKPIATICLPAGASNKAFMITHQESSSSTSGALPAMSWVPDLATGSFSKDALLHIATGVGCIGVVVGTMLKSEQAVLTNLRQLKKGSHDKTQ